jgi:hypothetical protein
MMFSMGSAPRLYNAEFKVSSSLSRAEAGSNTSTVTLRVVRGDGKGSLKSETVNMVVSPKGLGPENDCAG